MNALGAVLLTSEVAAGNEARLFLWRAVTDLRGGGLISASSSPDLNDAGLVVAAFGVDDSDEEANCGFMWDSKTGEQTLIGRGCQPCRHQ